MKNNILSIIAVIISMVALSMSSMNLASKDGNIEQALKDKPEMIISALQNYETQERERQEAAAIEMMASSVNDINNDSKTPFYGPATAKVTLAVFYDYSCGYCHRLYPILKGVIANNPDVKFAFKPLDFLGAISNYTAKAVLAADNQGKFAELNDLMFSYDGQLTEDKVDELAESVGIDVAQMKEDMRGYSEEALSGIRELAGKIEIRGVPTMIINGSPLQTFDENEIQAKINELK